VRHAPTGGSACLRGRARWLRVGATWEGEMKAFGIVLALVGCAPAEQPMVMIMPEIPACDTEALAGYVGAGREVLSGVRFKVPVRWIEPDGLVTLDYNPERINFKLDADGVITRIYCG